jgi:hypothetical protein
MAPQTARIPIVSHTINSQNGEPNDFAMPAGVRKIPTAMDSPATAAIAEAKPNLRCGALLANDSRSTCGVMGGKGYN